MCNGNDANVIDETAKLSVGEKPGTRPGTYNAGAPAYVVSSWEQQFSLAFSPL